MKWLFLWLALAPCAWGQPAATTALVPTTGRAALNTTVIAANQYQPLFAGGSIAHGCWVQNPATNSAPIYVDWYGATGTVLQGTSQMILPGDPPVKCDALYQNTVTVYSPVVQSFNAGIT